MGTSRPPSTPRTINIVPQSDHRPLSGSDPVGYLFSGLIPTSSGAVLLMELLPMQRLYLWELELVEIIDYQRIPVTESIRELASNPDRMIDLTDSDLYTYTNGEIIVHKSTGILERYNLEAVLADSIRTERRIGVLYAFSSNGRYMYRFDPESQSLQVMSTWW